MPYHTILKNRQPVCIMNKTIHLYAFYRDKALLGGVPMLERIIKKLKNPKKTFYDVFSVIERRMPRWMAKVISVGNYAHVPAAVRVKTYDMGGQCCHPSVSTFRGKTYMACTPYPYGVEFYENPCVYVKRAPEAGWEPMAGAFPIVRAERLGFEHYSDPCLFRSRERLTLLFRKCERRPEGKIDQLYQAYTLDGETWSAPERLLETAGDKLISPAAADEADRVFCVEYDGADDSCLVQYAVDEDMVLSQRQVCDVQGLDEAYYIWHIDVERRRDGLRGVFMLRKKYSALESKLAIFFQGPGDDVWRWERDVPLTDQEQGQIKYIYKSAFSDRSDRLLCSACDKRNRFFLFEKGI